MRLDSITRANEMLYEQTDRMKMLASKKLYCDVLHDRVQQINDKQIVKSKIVQEAANYHQKILQDVRDGEIMEQEKLKKAEEQIRTVAKSRKEQLDELNKKRDDERIEKEAIGIALKQRAQEMLEDEIKQQEARHNLALYNKKEILAANAKLKNLRIELAKQEREAEAARDAQIIKIDAQNNERKAIDAKFQAKTQQKRQSIIDAAVKRLSEQINTETAILEKQEMEIKDREDKANSDKEAKRSAEWEAIIKSRTDQMKARDELWNAKLDEDERMVELFKTANNAAIDAEKRKQEEAKARVMAIKTLQLKEAQILRQKKVDMKLLEIEADQILQREELDVDSKFIHRCKEVIRDYTEKGKPTYPLYVALEYKEPDLIGAKLDASKRRK